MSDDTIYERAVPFTITRSASSADGDGLTLEGYAAVFNSSAFINDRSGEYEETIAPGAFKRTIAGGNPVLMFEHGQHPVIGSMPIGSIQSLSEDARGLFLRARLFDNWMTEPLRHAIGADPPAIDGMSFRFEVVKDTRDTARSPELRTIREVKLYELGPVVFPAYRDTTVALRSLASTVPGLTLTYEQATQTQDPPTGTSDEPAATRSTSDEPAASNDDSAPSHSSPTPSTADQRKRLARQIEAARMGAGKK